MQSQAGAIKTRSILLVDDQPEFLKLARALLSSQPSLSVVGEATSGSSAVTLARRVKPDVAIIDVHMPGLGGFETAKQMLSQSPDLRVILVSAFDDAQFAALAKRAGAVAFITKKAFSPATILKALAA